MGVVGYGQVAHGGTYTGNTVGAAAANATLEILETQPVIESIFEQGQKLMDGFDEILTRAGIPHHMTGLPPAASAGATLGCAAILLLPMALTHWPAAQVEALRAVLAGKTVVSIEEVFVIERSLPHGHVEAVRSMIRKLGLERMLSSRRCRE